MIDDRRLEDAPHRHRMSARRAWGLSQPARWLLVWILGSTCTVAVSRSYSQPISGAQVAGYQEFAATRVTDQARLLSDRNAALLVDGPVDPDIYALGPGDLLGFEILGPYSISAESVVGADGSVSFPQLGTFWVAGLTLTQAGAELAEKGRSLVRGVEPKLLLKSPRTFKVHVIGAVELPGSQPATALTRVSEVLQAAGGVRPGSDTRNIRITHQDSTTSHADLLPFLLAGDLTRNPRLRDGDVVAVGPRLDDLQFSGAFLYAGRYPFVEGDELGELVSWIGLHPRAELSGALLQRFRDAAHWDTLRIDLRPVLDGVARIPLHPGDRVLVKAVGDWRTGSIAEVQGAVAFPGPIPLERGTVTAAKAVEMAGGYLVDAVPSRAVLTKPFLPDTSGVPDPIGSESFLSAVSASRIHERIVDLSNGSGPILEPGDVLHIPRVEPWVQVLGQVRNPGFYPYYAEWVVVDYIRAAGGFGKFADKRKTQVSKGRFGDVGYAEDIGPLAPGDLVWVPEKITKGFWDNFKDVIQVAGQAAALVLVAREITR